MHSAESLLEAPTGSAGKKKRPAFHSRMTTAKNDELSVLGLKDTKRAVRRPDPKGSYSFSLPSVRPGVHPAEPALLFEFGTLWLRKRLPRQQTHHNTSVVFFCGVLLQCHVGRRSRFSQQSK